MFGSKFSAPFYIAPAGGGKFAHPKGEIIWTRAAAKHGILQWVCNNAGCSQKEMADARGPGQILFWQIYAMKDLDVTKREIQQAVAMGYKGLALTVDAIRIGKRERDIRMHLPVCVGHNEPSNSSPRGRKKMETADPCFVYRVMVTMLG